MFQTNCKKNLWFLGLALGILPNALSGATAQAISLELLPSTQNVLLGDELAVDIAISGLGEDIAPSLSGFDLNISFDSNLFAYSSVTIGDPNLGDMLDLSDDPMSFAAVTPSVGTANFINITPDAELPFLNSVQPDSFILATLFLNTLGTGSSSLDLTVNALVNSDRELLTVNNISNASVTVNRRSVPEPSFGWLSLGIVLAVALRKRVDN
jgi:hypothetical protein